MTGKFNSFAIVIWQEEEHVFMWTIRSGGELLREGKDGNEEGARVSAYESLKELLFKR